jgi:7-carboxy-7-deazaguanine synthase
VSYSVKEIYYTLQGEGSQTGRAAVFCRFAGCNLWSGREEDRARATCNFCDTDFVGTDGPGGGNFITAAELAEKIAACWRGGNSAAARKLVVCTGGEPLLQLDTKLVAELHSWEFQIAVETNGTLPALSGLDWITVSPKAGSTLVQKSGDELKLVFPQPGADPETFAGLDFKYFYLQPMDGISREENIRQTMEYCMQNPQWRISLQTHKLLGIP